MDELRIPCNPDDVTLGHKQHKHQCDYCGTTWKHANALADPARCSHEDHIKAHTCPNCGEESYLKLWTRDEDYRLRRMTEQELEAEIG